VPGRRDVGLGKIKKVPFSVHAIYANTRRYLREYSLFTRVHAKYSLSTRILAEYTLSEYVEYMLNLRACPCHNFTVPCAY